MKSFLSDNNTPALENEECVKKKSKIESTGSDMEISSDDDVEIIENTDLSDLRHNCPPTLEERNNFSKSECQPQESLIHKPMSSCTLLPKIMTASDLLKNSYDPLRTVIDSPKDLLNNKSDSVAMHHVPQNHMPLHTANNTCSSSTSKEEMNGLLHNMYSQNNMIPIFDKNINDIFKEVSAILEPEKETELSLNQNIEHRLPVRQSAEVSSLKCNMNSLFGDDSDDESKIPVGDTKKKSLGVRLGMSSNLVKSHKINSKSHEPVKTIKNKTEDPIYKQKKFELSNQVVSLLNPYYKNNLFKTKELFKILARQIVHKLLESNNHPGKFIVFNKRV